LLAIKDQRTEFELTGSLTNINGANGNNRQSASRFSKLHHVITTPPISFSNEISDNIIKQLESSGFIDDNDVTNFAKGFIQREEVLSQILMQDFSWQVMDAHRARVGMIELVYQQSVETERPRLHSPEAERKDAGIPVSQPIIRTLVAQDKTNTDNAKVINVQQEPDPEVKLASWKSVLVNDKAKLRRTKKQSNGQEVSSNKDTYSYGLASTDREVYSTLFEELDNYWSFMTVPQTSTFAEPPIREKTAEVYRTHSRLFLGGCDFSSLLCAFYPLDLSFNLLCTPDRLDAECKVRRQHSFTH
jgi:hypothetical protein